MQDDRSDLMLFIDLGFILLVGFLVLTDSTPRENIPLPADEEAEQQEEPEGERYVYDVLFGADLDFVIIAAHNRSQVCAPVGLDALVACLVPLVAQPPGVTVFLLAPQGRATVQQLVSLLDLCFRNQWRCTVDS